MVSYPKSHRLLNEATFIVVGGNGGVGKTTLAAAIALDQALNGRRVGVLTIDPARRLAAALGLKRLGNKVRFIETGKLDRLRKGHGGALGAAMLDVKGTFDEMVRRYAPSPHTAERIIKNRLYDQLSQALSGTHEYMALEKIYEMRASGEFDCVVVDTPPSSAFVDFLNAPERIKKFFNAEITKWFMPKLMASPLGFGMDWAFSLFKKLAGGGVLEEVSQFLNDFQTMFSGLVERVRTIEALLQDPKTAFVYVVTSDSAEPPDVPPHLELSAFILNRAVPELKSSPKPKSSFDRKLLGTYEILLKKQKVAVGVLKKAFPKVPIVQVLLQEKDPATLNDLAKLLG